MMRNLTAREIAAFNVILSHHPYKVINYLRLVREVYIDDNFIKLFPEIGDNLITIDMAAEGKDIIGTICLNIMYQPDQIIENLIMVFYKNLETYFKEQYNCYIKMGVLNCPRRFNIDNLDPSAEYLDKNTTLYDIIRYLYPEKRWSNGFKLWLKMQ